MREDKIHEIGFLLAFVKKKHCQKLYLEGFFLTPTASLIMIALTVSVLLLSEDNKTRKDLCYGNTGSIAFFNFIFI